MDSLGLRVELHEPKELFNENDRIFYGEGGNFAPYWSDCREFLLHNQHANRIVLLPHTVKDQGEVLKQLGPNTILFARERRSFRRLKKLCATQIMHILTTI